MQINIESKIKNYTISFKNNFDFLNDIKNINPKALIIDKNIWDLYTNLFSKYFTQEEVIFVDAFETNKTVDYALQLCDSVLNSNAKKNMTIVSIGGGIVQDVSGFLSSILYRGVNWIFVPTTLLAQADSCMGSKTSINYKKFKNLLGTFYPPTQIFLNVAFTKTLSREDFYSGIGEVVKLHLMGGKEKIDQIAKKILILDESRDNDEFLNLLVQDSLSIKYSYIKDDEFDSGKRNLLNYGHCFGHAFEVASGYAVPHGTAVVIGMIFANMIAAERGLLSKETENYLLQVLMKSYSLHLKHEAFDKETILAALKMDKKRVGDGLPLITIQNNYELIKLTDMTPDELFGGIDKIIDLLEL